MTLHPALARHPGTFAAGLGGGVSAAVVALMVVLPIHVTLPLALLAGAVQGLVAYATWLPSGPGANARLATVSLALGVGVVAAMALVHD